MKKIKYIIIVILFTLTGCLNYVELNDIGIKFTNFQFLSKILLKVFILVLIFIIF